jgi:hypothetical protein
MAMRKYKCDALGRELWNDEQCSYEHIRREGDPNKFCVKCLHYKILYTKKNAKHISKEYPLEKAIREFSEATQVPKENLKFYIHIYGKINEARKDSISRIKDLQKMVKDQAELLRRTTNTGWLEEKECSFLWQNWLKFIVNKCQFSMWQLEKDFVKEGGKKTNPALEFLSRALLMDAEDFGKKPRYKEVSKLLSSIVKENKGHSYTVATLKDKYPLLKIPGLKFDRPVKKCSKVDLIVNTLIAVKLYFDAKGKSLLPNPPPAVAGSYARTVLQIFDIPNQWMPDSSGPRIPSVLRK